MAYLRSRCAPRPGYRLFFDPIGPFKEATLHRYKYALIVLDDFSGLLQTRLMVRLSEWFVHLSGLVKRIEAEKGSERVVAQIGSDSFPVFVEGHNMIDFAATRGIQLLASPPCTQKPRAANCGPRIKEFDVYVDFMGFQV